MKHGSVNVVTILLAAIIVAGGYYFLVYQPRHQAAITTLPVTETITPTTGANTTSTPTVDETEVLKAAMKAAIVAKRGPDAASMTYIVKKIEGNYAQGGASAQAGGGMWFAAKVNGTWNLVWDGNGVILCSDLTAYPDFPKTMIPECYNDKTNKTVTR